MGSRGAGMGQMGMTEAWDGRAELPAEGLATRKSVQ